MLEGEVATLPSRRGGRAYWQAQGIAELSLARFDDAGQRGDEPARRGAYYLLANYHRRTRRILRSAITDRREPLAQAALRNLVLLHRPLARMHATAPDTIPLASLLDRDDRDQLSRDLVVRVLDETPEALTEPAVATRVEELGLGRAPAATIRRHLADLADSGHVVRSDAAWRRTTRPYTEFDADAAGLTALLGPDVARPLGSAGFRGLADLEARGELFRTAFESVTGLGPATADLVVEAAIALIDTRPRGASPWRHADLLNSPYPRPYQHEAYAVFRATGHQGTLVESPTGSGKTLIGMLCIQDWLGTLRPGQSILVLVPTANYQQQWIGELCYKPIGLRLPPEIVFAGTPGQLERFTRRTGGHPAILLMTYAALAQAGSGVGKGGFDVDSIEIFLQQANVQYVVLDEVHKVVEDMASVSADVTRRLVEWQRDGSIRGLIGFSGTAEAYRPRFTQLGLTLAHSIPLDALVGSGFVAPFVEFGVPFSHSRREQQIRDLLDRTKADVLAFLALVGGERLRAWFSEIPLDERVAVGRGLLRMYAGRPDGDAATARRLTGWEAGGEISIGEAALVTILQVARGWSDADLAREAGVDEAAVDAARASLEAIRAELAELIYLPATVDRLRAPGFMTRLDGAALRDLPASGLAATARAERANDLLAATAVGLYEGLAGWYLRTGEGRVETIKAVIDAERATRPVSGVIVFDSGKRIRWRQGVTAPGYDGVGGLFAQLLGDERFVAFAALSSEMYLTRDQADPLPPRIAAFIEDSLMRGEVASAIFSLATQGLDLADDVLAELARSFTSLVDEYVAGLTAVRGRRIGEFRRRVLSPFRRTARRLVSGSPGERLRARLDTRNVHLAGLIVTFFDYAQIAESFRRARVAEIEQVSGARRSFFVVPMPAGRRKQLMYDLTARIVDAERLPVNLVIVSSWARTGWNVIRPNVLIDATATRDPTAWQQLRGRAMRALGTWTNDCYRLLAVLRSDVVDGAAASADGADGPDSAGEPATGETGRPTASAGDGLDDGLLRPLDGLRTVSADLRAGLDGGLERLSGEARKDLAVALLLGRNKVTHIFELVKASGSSKQVEFDRSTRRWNRRESIARKHAFESSVDPSTGQLVRGVDHAPLVYAEDPRTDLPADLGREVATAIRDLDPRAVAGWMGGSRD